MELGASGRTDEETARKENPVDFALWKSAKSGEISWDSPWGPGRPGWHIECSVMSTEILGDTIDIHGGGADLEFPHHTNEIAQSEAKTGKTFANYWMHNGFVNIDNVKMSKSLGNFITVHDALKTLDGQVLRFFFATQHYRKPINFTEKAVRDAETNLKYLKNTYEQPFTGNVDTQELQAFKDKFVAAMDEDFNSANRNHSSLWKWPNGSNSGNYDASVKQALADMLEVFGIVFVEEVLDAEIEDLIQKTPKKRVPIVTLCSGPDPWPNWLLKELSSLTPRMEWGGHVIDVNLINGIALAFEGDAVYSMYIRRHLILKGMTKPNKLHQEATKYVSAKAQARLISLMLEEQVLTEKEEEIYKTWPQYQ